MAFVLLLLGGAVAGIGDPGAPHRLPAPPELREGPPPPPGR
jgi:hypothetical protein